MRRLTQLIEEMIQWETGCPRRVGHFLKVFGYTMTIAESEDMDEGALETLEAAAIVHDIGIRPSLEKYGDDNGAHQEAEGPAPARTMLEKCGFPEPMIARICWLIAHHHTYTDVIDLDHRILLEADLLVNVEEGNIPDWQPMAKKVMQTKTGRQIFNELYGTTL